MNIIFFLLLFIIQKYLSRIAFHHTPFTVHALIKHGSFFTFFILIPIVCKVYDVVMELYFPQVLVSRG